MGESKVEKPQVAAPPEPSLAARKAALTQQLKTLNELEAKTVPGAPILTPKAQLLDARDVEAAHPEFRFRWVNTRYPDRVATRKSEGYEIVPDGEGGRRLGDEMALARIPREKYDARVARITRINEERLEAHKAEFKQVVESVAREMRDRYGLRETTLERLLKE